MMESNALLVIDVQNDFCPGGSLAIKDGDRVVPVINSLTPLFSIVIATQDWHPNEHISFASRYPNHNLYEGIIIDSIEQILWPDHCIQGSNGADFHPALETLRFSMILHKGFNRDLDSYSAFFENDRKTSTGLEGYLNSRNINTVYIAGLATDYCVYFSAMDSINLGFKTIVVSDAIKGVDIPEGNVSKAISSMKGAGILFNDSISITSELSQ